MSATRDIIRRAVCFQLALNGPAAAVRLRRRYRTFYGI